MTVTIVNVEQRSPEWFAARAGRLTSSVADCLFKEGRKKGEESYLRRDLRIRLALERLTGMSQEDEGVVTAAMQRGREKEVEARLAYEAATGQLVREVGFVSHNVHLVGTSPDGYVGNFEGVIDFKCPKSATHIGYLKDKRIPDDYLPQLRHHVWVTGAQWADFVSFDDRLPEHLQLVIYRATRDALDIPGYERVALDFLATVEREMADLQALRTAAA